MTINQDIVDVIMLASKYPVIRRVGVFGSYARGEQKIKSDIDVLYDYDRINKDYITEISNYNEDLEEEFNKLNLAFDYISYRGVIDSGNHESRKSILSDVIWIYEQENAFDERHYNSMVKSNKQDIQKINSIIESINYIKEIFNKNDITNVNNLKNDKISQAACTQFITNIQETKKFLQDETYKKLVKLNDIKLAVVRNIACHDYDSLDFARVFEKSKELIKTPVLLEIYAVLTELEEKEEGEQP